MGDEKEEEEHSPLSELSSSVLPSQPVEDQALDSLSNNSSDKEVQVEAVKGDAASKTRDNRGKERRVEASRADDRHPQIPPEDQKLSGKGEKGKRLETFRGEDRHKEGQSELSGPASASTAPSTLSKGNTVEAFDGEEPRDGANNPPATGSEMQLKSGAAPSLAGSAPSSHPNDEEAQQQIDASPPGMMTSSDNIDTVTPSRLRGGENDSDVPPNDPEAGRRGQAIPTAYAVEDSYQEALNVVPEPIPPPATLPDDSKINVNEGRLKKRRLTVLFFIVAAIVVVLISVGLTRGFGPGSTGDADSTTAGPTEQTPDGSIPEDKEEDPVEETEKSDSEDEPLTCPPIPPNLIFSFPPEYCDSDSNCWARVGPDLEGSIDDKFGNFVSLDGSGSRFAVSARHADTCEGEKAGIVRVYDVNSLGFFSQVGQDIEGVGDDDNRGALSRDGKRLAVGAPNNHGLFDDRNIGQFRVFELQEGNWTMLGDPVHGMVKKERLGHSVALSSSGNVLASGAIMSKVKGVERAGSVRVYNYSSVDNQWAQMGSDIQLTDPQYEDKFGWVVSLSENGEIVAIGQKNEDNDSGFNPGKGQISVFQYTSGNWTQLGNAIEGEAAGDAFGRDIAMSSDGKIVAGGTHHGYSNSTNVTDTGHVRVFAFNESDKMWHQLGGSIIGQVPGNKPHQVSLSGDGRRVAVSAGGRLSGFGYTSVYDFIGGDWQQVGGEIARDLQEDHFANDISMSLDGSRLLIGKALIDKAQVQLFQLR